MKTYYELLEILPDAPLKEITKSYFRLAAKCHPDLVQRLDSDIQKLANEKMRELNLAYQVLKNEAERARYDLQLKGIEESRVVQEESPPPSPPPPSPPSQTEKKQTIYPWDVVKEASLNRLKEILAGSALGLKPVEVFHHSFSRIFEGKKGLNHYLVFVRIEETITPVVLNQVLSGLSIPLKVGHSWNPLQKTQFLVCLMGWGFHDLASLKKGVQEHNRGLLSEKKGQKKDQKAFVALFDFTTEQIYAPDLNSAITPLMTALREISFQGK